MADEVLFLGWVSQFGSVEFGEGEVGEGVFGDEDE